MTIRNRLTLLFTGLIAIILLTLNVYVYSLSDLFTDREFSTRVEERAKLAANIFLEKDETKDASFEKVEQRFLQGLPEEVTRIYNRQGKMVFEHQTGSFQLPDTLLQGLKRTSRLHYTKEARHVIGLRYQDNQGEYYILTSALDKYGFTKLQNLKRVLMIGFVVGITLVFFTGRYFSLKALQPMSAIVGQVQQIKANNLHLRVNGGNNKDEVAELARTFNGMLARLESSFDSQRTFVRNASHELRTPLAVMIGETEVALARNRSEDYYREALTTVLTEARKMTHLVNDLLSLANHENTAGHFEDQVRIDEVLWEIHEEMLRTFPGNKLEFNLDRLPENPDLITVYGNQAYLRRAIGNIVNNALKYSNGQPAKITVIPLEKQVQIQVIDHGIGIKEDDLQRIFQPFFRGANARHREGHGIGLSLAMSVFQMHGGTVHVNSTLGKGTTVDIMLPTV